jgi:hypothetical protein
MPFDLRAHVDQAFENAERSISKITPDILAMEGMSGVKTRHFYNNILNCEDARYLEIGTWKGSSVCSAMCGNQATVVAIDNWSEFNGPKNEFIGNFERYRGNNHATFIEKDCFEIDVKTLPFFNIYLYDGEHSRESHRMALTHYYDCLDSRFLFIVDDWNWERVRQGTKESIEQLGLHAEYEREIRTTDDDSHPTVQMDWHNGIYVAILQK